jgi:hypothetical protein
MWKKYLGMGKQVATLKQVPALYLLMIYAKVRQENLTAEEKKIVRKLATILKS